jgi:hypothetical protein
MQTLAKFNFFVRLSNTEKPLHHVLKQTYRAESLGNWENFIPLYSPDNMHPGAKHLLIFPFNLQEK